MAVQFVFNDPPGTQLLKLGYQRIEDINNNLIAMFGAGATINFGAPFSFFDAAAQAAGRLSVVAPVNPNEIARLIDVNAKVVVSTDLNTSDGGASYTGTATPVITAYDTTALYVVTNIGVANSGPVSIQLGGGFVLLEHANGSPLAAGDFAAGQVAILVFDGTNFRFINFIGGTLAGDPTLGLGAATKQYVDNTVNPPIARAPMSQPTVALTAAGADIITVPPITFPADSNQYNLFVDFMCYVTVTLPQERESDTYFWVTDGTNFWAFASNSFRNGTNGNGDAHPVLAGSGFAPVTYAGGSTVNLKLQGAQATSAGVSAVAQQTKFAGVGPATWPQSYLTATTMRSHT